MTLPENDDIARMTHQSKKKRVDDPLLPDLGQKPIQLQRRRVWRACESCRRKKIKCDGCEPTCSQCGASGSQCTWLQTKDRAALSRHYVQELEARLLHMESLFNQLTPVIEQLEQSPNGFNIPGLSSVLASSSSNSALPPHASSPPSGNDSDDVQATNGHNADMLSSGTPPPVKLEDDMAESFGQLALDEHGHMRWIGGSSTMSLIQSFRALTSTSPLHRVSPEEEDPRAPNPSANKLYFPASVFFGKVRALPGPEEVEYPERDLADKLVEAYFSRYHFLIPVLDKPTFLRQYRFLMDHRDDVSLHRRETAFIALVFSVFACAAQLVDDPRLSTEDPESGGMGMIYYERSLVLQYISHTSLQISYVQCFILQSSFLCSVNCLPQAWLIIGQAVRSAQDLGLHRSPRRLNISPIEKETRRKIWWGVYTLDRMLAVALGRPMAVEDADCDVELPAPYDDDELPEYFTGAQMTRDQPSLMAGFVALITLYQIAGRVLRRVYALDMCKEHLEPEKRQELQRTVDALDMDLAKWCDEIPAQLKHTPTTEQQVSLGAVLASHWYSVLTTLHRNFVPTRRDQPLSPRSTTKAVTSARACIRLAPSIRNVVPPSHHLAFFIQHLFSSAVIILLYAMHVVDLRASATAMDEAKSCLSAIESWEGHWPGARKCKELLKELMNTASEAIRSGPRVTPSTMSSRSPGSPAVPLPGGRRNRRLSDNNLPSPMSPLSDRVIRNKPNRRTFSPESSQSPRRAYHASSYSLDTTQRARSTSRKRHYDETDGAQEIKRSSSLYRTTSALSSSFPSQSHMVSPHGSPASVNSLPSPMLPVDAVPSGRTPPRIMTSTSYGGMNAPVSPTNVPLPSSPRFDYTFGLSHTPMNQPSSDGWNTNGATDVDGMSFNYSSNQSQTAAASLTPGQWQQSSVSPIFLGYDGSSDVRDLPTNNLSDYSTTFDGPGLPFRGLDFIRNYNPGGYAAGNDPNDFWQTFDAGVFRYDPEVPFLLGDPPTDSQMGQP